MNMQQVLAAVLILAIIGQCACIAADYFSGWVAFHVAGWIAFGAWIAVSVGQRAS